MKWIAPFIFVLIPFCLTTAHAAVEETIEEQSRKPAQEKLPEKEISYDEFKKRPNQARPVKVKHPGAKRGLKRITKERVYVYDVKKPKGDKAAAVRFGTFAPNSFLSADGTKSFADLYPNNNILISFDYEWKWLNLGIGRLNLKAGSGLLVAQGNGYFISDGLTAREKLTFVMFPNNAGLIYRFKFWDTQAITPYVEGGGGYYTFAEIRDDGESPKFGGALATHFAVGGALNLGFLDSANIISLDREYGIKSVAFTGEYRSIIGLDSRKDLTSDNFNFGFLAEF